MSKTLLVAQREYYENVRTKTFWIGILSVPVLIVLSVFIPRWLEDAKDVRHYAVIDQSGWLLEAIEKGAAYDDILCVLEFAKKKAGEGKSAVAKLPVGIRMVAEQVKDLTTDQLRAQAQAWSAMAAKLQAGGSAPALGGGPGGLSGEAALEAVTWSVLKSPEEARELGAGIKKEDYVRIEIPAGEPDPEAYLRSLLSKGSKELFAYFVIGPDPLAGEEGANKYVSNNRTDEDLKDWISRLASREVVSMRFEEAQIDEDVAQKIQREVVFEEKQLSATGEESDVSKEDTILQWAPVVFVYLLWISVFTAIQMLITNTIEEKSNRIIEVLLSSVSPLELMVGKVGGIAATGLTLVGTWVLCFILALKYLPGMLGIDMEVDLSVLISSPTFLASFLIYFFLGYLLYAALLAGLGSLCNSVKEAQNFMTPVMVVMMVPLLAMIPVGKDPNGTLAVVLSYIPPFTPFVMMNRAAGPPELWEYVLTTILLAISIGIAFWGAAKIFRIGILMTGKPPKIGDLIRFLRAPVGAIPEARDAE